jgi:hypothetical protein
MKRRRILSGETSPGNLSIKNTLAAFSRSHHVVGFPYCYGNRSSICIILNFMQMAYCVPHSNVFEKIRRKVYKKSGFLARDQDLIHYN